MSKSNAFETALLQLVFNATPIPNMADNAASGPFAQYYIALHTSDPGEAGTQATSEANYTGYTRIPVARTTGGWLVSGNQASNVAVVTFPNCTAGTNTITHASVGTGASGATQILYSGQLQSPIAISTANTPPDFPAGALVMSED
jgi:hypothetical protein